MKAIREVPLYRLLTEIGVVVLVAVAVMTLSSRNPEASNIVEDQVLLTPPAMTPHMENVLKESTGFQHLVSYTDRGFVPDTLNIKNGETVRFTNNSSHNLWVASSASGSDRLYPSEPDESCGQSAFDSCVSMKPLEFWEFTFDETGEWSYMNNVTPSDTAVVRAQ